MLHRQYSKLRSAITEISFSRELIPIEHVRLWIRNTYVVAALRTYAMKDLVHGISIRRNCYALIKISQFYNYLNGERLHQTIWVCNYSQVAVLQLRIKTAARTRSFGWNKIIKKFMRIHIFVKININSIARLILHGRINLLKVSNVNFGASCLKFQEVSRIYFTLRFH